MKQFDGLVTFAPQPMESLTINIPNDQLTQLQELAAQKGISSALGFSLIQNHPFIDGNKRIGHAAMEVFLVLNGFEIDASVDEQERVILQVASGNLSREDFTQWLQNAIVLLQHDRFNSDRDL